jgi:hypothetical protein
MRLQTVLPSLLAVAVTATAAPAAHAAAAPRAATAAHAAARAGSPFAPLKHAITANRAPLGKKATRDLNRRVSRAKTDYAHHRWCPVVTDLGGIVKATKHLRSTPRLAAGAQVAAPARALQRKVFLAHAAGHGSCGLAAPKLSVSKTKAKPTVATIPGLGGGAPRPVSALVGSHARTDFVSNELVVSSNDAAKVSALAKRWNGAVVEHHDATTPGGLDTWNLRIDASKADVAGVSADLRTLDPLARGNAAVSDRAGLDLIAVAADAATHGLTVAPNLLVRGSADAAPGPEAFHTSEEPTGGAPWNPDGFAPWYNAAGGVTDTGDAWRTLKVGGFMGNRVKLAVVDGGMTAVSGDFSGNTGDWEAGQNPLPCSGGNGCPFHGTNVASAAASVVDNGVGVAGSGGQVASVQAVQLDGTLFAEINGVYEAFEAGAKVINLSQGGEIDALVSEFAVPMSDAAQTAREHGALVVAAAGNEGRDVDAEDCFIVCWEEEIIIPCENDTVVCVGGITADRRRDPGSNFGFEWTEDAASSDVDLFAPYTVWVGADGAIAKNHMVNGTSFSRRRTSPGSPR